MTELEMELQQLRRRVEALEADNRRLRYENTRSQFEKQLDMAEKTRLRRQIEAMEEERE